MILNSRVILFLEILQLLYPEVSIDSSELHDNDTTSQPYGASKKRQKKKRQETCNIYRPH